LKVRTEKGDFPCYLKTESEIYPEDASLLFKMIHVEIKSMDLRMEWYRLDRSGSGWGPVEGSCEHGNKLSSSVKFWEVLE
jgi:hypothetical protein